MHRRRQWLETTTTMIATTTTTTTTTTTATPMASRTTPANKIFYRSLAANVLYPGSSIVQKSGCNVCRVAHPRNDRFLHHRDRFTTSLQPFFPRPFSAGANFFFFFFFVLAILLFSSRVPSYVQASVVIQFVTQTEVLITSFRLICTFRGEQQQQQHQKF